MRGKMVSVSPNECDPSCNNVWSLMQVWLYLTPDFRLIVMLISSPLSLLVALWGMTSKRALQAMKRSGGGMVSLRGNPLLGQGEGR
jgi:hypothetical protein